jgi:hypothetical protein
MTYKTMQVNAFHNADQKHTDIKYRFLQDLHQSIYSVIHLQQDHLSAINEHRDLDTLLENMDTITEYNFPLLLSFTLQASFSPEWDCWLGPLLRAYSH